MTPLIGITGRAHHGKDSFAKAFIGAGYQSIAFANALKNVTAMIAGEDPELYFSEVHKELMSPHLGTTRREAQQHVGKAVREALGPMVWVNRALQTWAELGKKAAVITDVRYDNEAKAIRDLGGFVVRVTRPGHEGLAGAAASHESEQGVNDDLVDIEVLNDGTLGDLRHEACKIIGYMDRRREAEKLLGGVGLRGGRFLCMDTCIDALETRGPRNPPGFMPGHLGMDL